MLGGNKKKNFYPLTAQFYWLLTVLYHQKLNIKIEFITTGVVGFAGCKHIPGEIGETKDFSAIIEHAKKCPPPTQIETGSIVGGFAHNQVLALADKVVEAVKSGAIKKFVVMAAVMVVN